MSERHRSHEASAPSMLTFIAADTFSFVLFLAVFMGERFTQPDLFSQSAGRLDMGLGLLNTLILITSGWLVALAVAAARSGDLAGVRRKLMLAIAVGSCFGIVKMIEYSDKISHGITPMTNDFFTYYYILTGVHFLHVIIGIALLVILVVMTGKTKQADARYMTWLESSAIYWHKIGRAHV